MTKATCSNCGTTLNSKNNIRTARKTITDSPMCTRCWDRAGEDNMVSDGNMTCAEYQLHWGEHSEYCDNTDKDVEPVTGTCQCKCGGSPKGKRSRFLPGHDMRNGGLHARIAAAQ